MKKRKYREIYHSNIKDNKKEKSTDNVEKKKENIEKDKKGFNVFFEPIFRDEKKKSSDE